MKDVKQRGQEKHSGQSTQQWDQSPQQTSSQATAEAWHTLHEDAVLDKLASNLQNGLSEEEVRTRQEQSGPNALPQHGTPPFAMLFLRQFKSPLIYILLVAAVGSLAIGDAKDASFIFIVLLLNATLGSIQEWRAEKSATALQELVQTQAHVIRGGHKQNISQEGLVPGDVVLLESGNKVPADLRMLEANNLSIDESLLTGESLPVDKSPQVIPEADTPIGDRCNMAYAGSLIIRGRGTGVVSAIGLDTEMGTIAESVSSGKSAKTPLIIRMEEFTGRIAWIVLGSTFILGVVAVLKGLSVMDALFLAVALAVSVIPEGLPVVMTVALSIATQRMAKRSVIVRKLPAVEGLGSCTHILSDKTGTLTVNKQTLQQVLLPDDRRFQATGEGYRGEGEITLLDGQEENPREALERFTRAGVICSEGSLNKPSEGSGEWEAEGDAVDIAVLAFAYKLGLPPEEIREGIEVTGQIPYESERGYAATFYQENGKTHVAAKGGAEHLLKFCESVHTAEGVSPIDMRKIEEQAHAFAKEGFRVLVIAEAQDCPAPTSSEDLPELPPLTVLGLMGLIDPLRPEAKEAVRKCQEAGIQIAMVTGDHPATALAIARELGIAETEKDVMTGNMLGKVCAQEASQECLTQINDSRVFARVSPIQKVEILEALMNQGHFVAVTGDGVNDAPALRKANIGVAMGSGSDVTKDVAAIIVTDDNFATIEVGVEEGRFAYDNIRKVIWFLISNGTAEILFFMLTLFFNLPLPLLPVQLLWANLVNSGIQDIALAFEAGEPEVMQYPPHKPTDGLFNRAMLNQTLVSGITMGLVCFGVFVWAIQSGQDEGTARNLTLLALILLENYNVFNCRSQYKSAFKVPLKNNYVLVWAVLGAHALHIFAMNNPLMQSVLGLQPVSFWQWLQLFLLASLVLVAVEIFKRFRKQPHHSHTDAPNAPQAA